MEVVGGDVHRGRAGGKGLAQSEGGGDATESRRGLHPKTAMTG